MLLFSMVSLIKDQQVDLVNLNKGMKQALMKYFCRTDNNHISFEVAFPGLLIPEICLHCTTKFVYLLRYIVL